jgi:hypothetical protein
MDQGQLLIGLISVIIMFIPIGGLLWKISRIVFNVDKNSADIDKLGKMIRDRDDRFDQRLVETESKLSNLEIIMGRMEEKINSILKFYEK